MDLYLIRHGESTQNTKENFKKRLPGFMVNLTDKGASQCEDAGLFLKSCVQLYD